MGHQVGVRGDCVDLVSLTDVPDIDYVITASGGNVVSVCVCVCVCACVCVCCLPIDIDSTKLHLYISQNLSLLSSLRMAGECGAELLGQQIRKEDVSACTHWVCVCLPASNPKGQVCMIS